MARDDHQPLRGHPRQRWSPALRPSVRQPDLHRYRKGLCAAGHGETRRQEVVQNAGALALQLVSNLLVVVPAARKLFLLLLNGPLDFREALGLVEELSLAPPLP